MERTMRVYNVASSAENHELPLAKWLNITVFTFTRVAEEY